MTVIWPMIDKSQPQEMLIKYQADMNVQVYISNWQNSLSKPTNICAFQGLNARSIKPYHNDGNLQSSSFSNRHLIKIITYDHSQWYFIN